MQQVCRSHLCPSDCLSIGRELAGVAHSTRLLCCQRGYSGHPQGASQEDSDGISCSHHNAAQCAPLSLSLSLWSLQSREPPLCLSVCPRKACGRLSPVSQTRFKCSPRLKCMFELFVLNKSNLHWYTVKYVRALVLSQDAHQ